MPLYEFECPDCGNCFDAMKPIAHRGEPEPCPGCGKAAHMRIAAAAVLRGATPCGSESCSPRRSVLADPPCCGGGSCSH